MFLYQLRSHLFTLRAFAVSGYKAKSYVLAALFYPLILAATYLKTHVKEKHLKSTESAGCLLRVLTSWKCLCGEFWFIVAARQGEEVARKTKLPEWSEPYT